MDFKFSPDGKLLTYLRTGEDDRQRMDLWRVDLHDGLHRQWLDARALEDGHSKTTDLTAAERAERERRRQFSHGITAATWHADGERLLIPIDGRAVLVDPDRTEEAQWIGTLGTRQSGFQLSPQGRYVSYVRDGDLYIWDLAAAIERRLTHDGVETISNGLPDFLAAEEMHRFEGHWWSADERHLLFCRVDESEIEVSYRLEMEADGAHTIAQRYPYAGRPNPNTELHLYHLHEDAASLLWRSTEGEPYLARVLPVDDGILIQVQDRLQQRLSLRHRHWHEDTWQEIHAQTSDTWINLTDDLRQLPDGRLLWSTEVAGTRSLMLLDAQGASTELTGPTHVNRIVAADDEQAWVSGWDEDPQQNHLYVIPFDQTTSQAQRITHDTGWHDVTMSPDNSCFVDRFSAPEVPYRVDVVDTAGSDARTVQSGGIDSDHPYFAYLGSHAEPMFGSVTAADGQPLYYRLTPPAAVNGTHATIVYVYGGPGPQKARRDWGTLLVQMFAQQGFGVLELDNRGTGNRGARFEAPIYRRLGGVEVEDQVAGLAALDEVAWADRRRVGVFGHSYGGYMTLMCLCRTATHFAAGVAVAPVCDWLLYDTHYTERYMGLPDDNPDGYRQANVLTHLQHLQAPLLLMHGMADDNVLFTHSTKIMGRLQELGKPFELMTYPGAKHSMQERDVSIHRFDMILSFFARTLNQAPPD